MREQVHLLQPSVAEIIANELVGVYAETPGDMNTDTPGGVYTDTPGGRVQGSVHRNPRGACTGLCTQIPQGGVYRAVYTDTPGGRVQGCVHRYPRGACTQKPQGTCTSTGPSDCTKVKGEGLLPHTLESAARFPFCSFL